MAALTTYRVMTIISLFSIFVLIFVLSFYKVSISPAVPHPLSVSSLPNDLEDIIIDVSQSLKKARIHARGMKTQTELTHAIQKIDSYFRKRKLSFDKIVKRKSLAYQFVCPEVFTSIEHDSPIYENNYKLQDCSHAQPFHSFLTFIFVCIDINVPQIEQMIGNIRSLYAKIKIKIGILTDNTSRKKPNIFEKLENMEVTMYPQGTAVGKIWNDLIADVKTEFIFIGRDMRYFSNDSNVNRLIREIQRLQVTAIGGSIINKENRLHIGCHQRAFRNFSLVFQEGYDESFHDCLFCDHIDGPFIIRTKDFKSVQFDDKIKPMGLFEDLFMRLKGEMAICPDSMFYTNTLIRSDKLEDWKSFGNKLNLFKLKFSSGVQIDFGCNGKYSCPKATGYTHSPCCIQELTRLVNDVDKTCLKNNILCEINCGNLIGALKLDNALPWELDADTRIYYANVTAFRKLEKVFVKMGYRFKNTGSVKEEDCTKGVEKVPGVVDISSSHWVLSVYSFCYSPSKSALSKGLNLTFVSHHGHYAVAPRNPALYVRNKYAHEPFAHAQHFSVIHLKDTEAFTPSVFTKCKTPGRQDCLDLYTTDGNIQFKDLIP